MRAIAALGMRAWLRYLVPLTILSAVALAGVAVIAWRIAPAHDLADARGQLRLGWVMVGVAWIAQLLLVAGVAPAVRGVATGQAPSQLRALARGLVGLARGVVPCAVTVAAVVIGGLALVVPGLVLLVLFAMTGASERIGEPLPAALTDSAAVAKRLGAPLILLVVLVVVVDVAIGGVAQLAIVHALKKPATTDALAATRVFVRAVAIALIAWSPLAACGLGAAYERRAP
jgi:hypothetical protein